MRWTAQTVSDLGLELHHVGVETVEALIHDHVHERLAHLSVGYAYRELPNFLRAEDTRSGCIMPTPPSNTSMEISKFVIRCHVAFAISDPKRGNSPRLVLKCVMV